MYIYLTPVGGSKKHLRLNVESICYYFVTPQGNASVWTNNGMSVPVEETPEAIDSLLNECYITLKQPNDLPLPPVEANPYTPHQGESDV